MKAPLLTLAILCAFAFPAFAAKPGWTDDYAKAQEAAKTGKKHILLDFTGSDWCGWCIKLDKEVFSKANFKSFAKQSLELVELDYPKSKQLPSKVKTQNTEMKGQYDIHGFPTLILLDSEGKEVKRWVGFKATFFDELKAAAGGSSPS